MLRLRLLHRCPTVRNDVSLKSRDGQSAIQYSRLHLVILHDQDASAVIQMSLSRSHSLVLATRCCCALSRKETQTSFNVKRPPHAISLSP
jgi:hypothetical protein